MKKILCICASLLYLAAPLSLLADNISRGGYGERPASILEAVVKEANKNYQIQESQLDGMTSTADSV
jgi:hypothetical protein